MLEQVRTRELLFHELDDFATYLVQAVGLWDLVLNEWPKGLADFALLVVPALLLQAQM